MLTARFCSRGGASDFRVALLLRPRRRRAAPAVELLRLLAMAEAASPRRGHQPLLRPGDRPLHRCRRPLHGHGAFSNDGGISRDPDERFFGGRDSNSTRDPSGDACDLCCLPQVFTSIYTVEMVIKMVALDPYGYFKVRLDVTSNHTTIPAVAKVTSCSTGELEHL